MIKKTSLLVCSALASQFALADNSNIQSVIDSFTNCDNSFFYQLKANANDFSEIADLIIENDIAYIPVENVTSHDGNTYTFKQPIEYRGLNVTGYQNIYIETPFLGQYYYWGLIIDGSIDDVKNSLQQLSWHQYNVTSYIANPRLYDRQAKDKGWQNNPYAIDNVIPRSFTAEKSLYLEPINENKVHLVCSIQGDMDSELFYSIRPDMKTVDEQLKAEREAKIKELKEKRQKLKQQQDAQKESQTNNTPQNNDAQNDEKVNEEI